MKKETLAILTLLSCLPLLSFVSAYSVDDELLNLEDREMEQKDAESGPGLSSTIGEEPQWESYWQWNCFPTRFAAVDCVELDYGAMHVPTLRVSVGGALFDYERTESIQLHDFSLEEEPESGCATIAEKWKNLLDSEDSVCIYAASLQELPVESYTEEKVERWTLDIMTQLKTRKGYWKESESDFEEDIAATPSSESVENEDQPD